MDVAVAAHAVAAAVAAAVVALPGELAAGARPTHCVIASINVSYSWPGSTKSTRPILVIVLGRDVQSWSPADAGAATTVFQIMVLHDFPGRLSRIDVSDLRQPLTAPHPPQELPR